MDQPLAWNGWKWKKERNSSNIAQKVVRRQCCHGENNEKTRVHNIRTFNTFI